MYAGHFALGLGLKARKPEAPTWGLLLGVGLLDVLFGPFVLLGIERISMKPGHSPGFTLDFIDWSHSLLAAIVWSLLYALFFLRRGKAIAALLGFAVFSHFLLDLPMHPSDLALWPHSRAHVGIGLWNTPYWWWFELAFVVAGCSYYLVRARQLRTFGGHAAWVCGIVLALHVMNSPWLAPNR
ncbi:MAG: metal-dependent hydrolase [Candidatus Eiseniibacteriota bacterium]